MNRAAAVSAMRRLALGDAFGETWLLLPTAEMEIAVVERRWNDAPWPWTDFNAMALSLRRVLDRHGHVDHKFDLIRS